MSQPAYNLRNIRKLLTTAFTDQELSQLCYETPEFRPVYEQFTAGMSKDQMIQRLIEYCERKVLMGQLLTIVEEETPEQYALVADSLIVGGKKPESAPSSGSTIPDQTEFLRKLISEKTRYLHTLQLQAAKFGISAPPHIVLEIEDLEKEIAGLQQKLNG
ncbi:MAG: hypothetical protein HS126_18305 [Anaerolineales bacterium]|nr:hypothetical protein [Anaerolineales bacterium]